MMGKPSRTRDMVGAVLLVLVGLLYMTGVTDTPVERGADVGGGAEIQGVTVPLTVDAGTDIRT